ncbi:methylase involved in ubiquinone/menaquinone biosynthesis [Bradyrhizobium sp. WSM471]|nr:methylase involved in ubiquinone/menaquinone biosynthesis [Bradyrhizobium sp. WSM471]
MALSSTFVASSGDGYELQMGRWSRRLAELFLDFCGPCDGEFILDAGCGTGALTSAILKRASTAQISGIDFSSAYVEHASRSNPRKQAQFSVGDVCALPYDDATFDHVLSLLVLHFVPDTSKAVAEFRRVARPGATIGAAVWDARGGFVAARIFFDTAAALFPSGNERRARNNTRPMTRPGELTQAWRGGGLIDVQGALLTTRMEFASFEDYWAPYEGKDGPGAEYVASLQIEARRRLRDAVRAAYLDGEADGPRSFAASAWAVKGTVPT